MLLPLPPMYGLVLDASVRGGWTVTEYDGTRLAADKMLRYTGVLAVRGDLRVQVEWDCETAGGRVAGPWRRRHAETAVRHPGHDPADWGLPHPRRWRYPATRDTGRRSPAGSVYSVVRLLGLPDDALSAAVLERCRGAGALASGR